MMVSVLIILSALTLMAFSGLPAVLLPSRSSCGQLVTVVLFVIGSLLGITGTVLSLTQPTAAEFCIPWTLPWGAFSISIDLLSAFFLVLIFTVPALGSVYSLGYWKQSEHPDNGAKLGVFYGLLAGSMALIVIAHDAILFLMAWEIMALSAFFVLTTEDECAEVRDAGWIYFVATHIGTLILFAFFALWRTATGSFSLDIPQSMSMLMASFLFIIAFVGFGLKAGLMPLHFWLPGAHASAPSHVSAVMSAVVLNMGIYGIVRVTSLLPVCAFWWGIVLLIAGAVSGFLGILFALSQHDLKRMLAYSSVENVGIITMGIGLALIGKFFERPDLILLGMGSALFHVWNHGLFKSLLFFNSGAIIHASGTRDIDLMGGLAKKMPATAALFLIGSISICALPPFNGFASEWLLYLGLFRTLVSSGTEGLSLVGILVSVLALIGALAVATCVKMYGSVFLGSPRTERGNTAPGTAVHEPVWTMRLPMIILASLCIITGLFPMFVSPFLESAVQSWVPNLQLHTHIAELAPQLWITFVGLGVFVVIVLLSVFRKIFDKKKKVSNGITWDCGYAEPTVRMQYTGTSYSQAPVKLFSSILAPEITYQKQEAFFPDKTNFESSVDDPVLDKTVLPGFELLNNSLKKMYVFQQGQTHLYILYIFVMAFVLFICSAFGANI